MGKIAFVFPGQGAQVVGMGQNVYENSAVAKDVFEQASKAVDLDLKALCFEENNDINITEFTQVCLRKRGIFMQEEVPAGKGGMAAILGMDAAEIDKNIEEFDKVQVANYNCPGQIVISGETEQVKQAADKLKEAGAKRAVLLNVSGPFHSSLLTGAGEKLEAVLKELTIEKPQIPYVANVDASYITEQADIMPRLVSQVSHSVRWQQSVEKMVENGVDTFIEIGPGRTLAGFNKKIAKAIGKELTTYNVATMEDIDKVVEALK